MPEGYQVELEALRSGIRAMDPMIENAEQVGRFLATAADTDPRKMGGGGGTMTGVPGSLLVTAVKLDGAANQLRDKHDKLTGSLHKFRESLQIALRNYADQEDRAQGALGSVNRRMDEGGHHG